MPMNIGPDSALHDGSAITPSNDPMRVARQAIRSQVTAREYIERQLAQAQNAIEELRAKLRHVHHEREVAVSAAQSAIAARDIAERSMRAAESASTSERANRARIEGMLRDAETTIRDLREKLATANQTTQVERAAERLNRQSADEGLIVASEATVPTARDSGWPVVKRPVGRPRKMVDAEPIQASAKPSEEAQASGEATAKLAGKMAKEDRGRRADDQEPVQWWVEGWKNK
jgi:hypothetical protein